MFFFFSLLLKRGGGVFSMGLGGGGGDPPLEEGAGFAPLGRGGTVTPHISFSLAREKETCRSPRQVPRFARLRSETRLRAQARYKEKERLERLSWRKLLLFRMCLCPDSGCLGAMRTGFTFCAADADGCGSAGLRAGTSGFRCESRFFFLCVYVLMVGSLVLCGLVFPLAPLPLRGAGALMDYRSIW